tara:strand:+ start:4100 stop:5038 length:939 start_codon:yes stop_codon:yes gene_type:complete
MDPFTIALATFGVQKLRGKSTKRALRDAAIVGGGAYALGPSGAGVFQNVGGGAPFSTLGFGQSAAAAPQGNLGASFLNKANMPAGTPIGTDKFGNTIFSRGGELSGLNVVPKTAEKKGLSALLQKAKDKPIESLLVASAFSPLLAGEEEIPEPVFTEEDYKKAYKEQSEKLQGAFEPVSNAFPARSEVFGSNMFYANQGGLATAIPKYNQGGINYLPSKIDHNENDVNNYVRATGYVEDGAGAGNKDEDTMLAQLADGEFVSRADAVLGAGILSGADPKSFKGMRKAGADFFYDQQKKFKRIYDLVNDTKKN